MKEEEETQIIELRIPRNSTKPDLSLLTPIYTIHILETAVNNIKEFNKLSTSLTQEEIYEKVKEETKEEIRKVELDMLVEKKYSIMVKEDAEQRILKAFDEINNLRLELKQLKQDPKVINKEYIDEQVKIEKDKFEAIMNEKERQNQLTRDTFEKCSTVIKNLTAVKTAVDIGKEGEQRFEDFAETFNDFEGFEIIDTHKESNKGDFHLIFKEFNVLVDAKNYSSIVPTKEITKIKNDLLANPHIDFAWLISLNTDLRNCSKSPITYDTIDGRIVIYVNNLSQYKNPQKFLRILWSSCKELKRLIIDKDELNEDPNEDKEELNEYKMMHKKGIEKIKGYMHNTNEMIKSINNLKKIMDNMQISMRETIDEDIKKITGEDISDCKLLEEWWDKNMEFVEDEDAIIRSTDIWYKFKSDPVNEGKMELINVSRFKHMLIQHLDSLGHHSYIRSKGKMSVVEIKNYKLKNNELIKKPENIAKVIKIITEKKKITKSKLDLPIETVDAIKKLYVEDKKNIMEISELNNCKIWEVVSVLMNDKIISKRQEALGYNIYQETEEYKSKCVK